MPTAIILMGVSGCGKTSVGQGLSAALGWPFYDGDDYMPQANIDKMANGIPLDDADSPFHIYILVGPEFLWLSVS